MKCTPEQLKAKREWRARNRDKYLAIARKYRAENRDKCRKSQREYYSKNKENHVLYSREWRAKNPEKNKAAQKRHYDKNKESLRLRNKEYRKNNPRAILINRLQNRTATWIRGAMRERTKLSAHAAALYLEWQAKKRGIDILGCDIHHLRAVANYCPLDPDQFKMMHDTANLWLISPAENSRIRDGESPLEMIAEAQSLHTLWILETL